MADENEYDLYEDLDVEGSAPTEEEYLEAGLPEQWAQYGENRGGDFSEVEEAIAQGAYGGPGSEGAQSFLRDIEEAKKAAARREMGLTGERVFDYAERLKDIAEGRRKTEGQIEAEKQLEILSKAQRGRAMGLGGFDTAELLQRAGRSAQQAELGGESAIAQAAKQAQLAAEDQLEQLLIAGEQRAEDRAFAMQQLAFQEEQASGSLWSNVLGGVLGAVGAVVGAAVGGPAGAVAGGAAGSAVGSGTGRYLG